MKIIPFEQQYLKEMVQLFIDEYSVPGYEWSLSVTEEYLKRDLNNFPQYCLVAVDDNNNFIGGILCRVDPYYKGHFLFIDVLHVKKEYRKKSVAKSLLKQVMIIAKENKLEGIHFLV